MNNHMIILLESIKLMEDGVINGTGLKIKVENDDGSIKELDMPEEIHTYNAWKSKGFQVKKGEKAVAKFPIWKYTTQVSKESEETVDKIDADNTGKMFMKISAFFTKNQVEPIQ